MRIFLYLINPITGFFNLYLLFYYDILFPEISSGGQWFNMVDFFFFSVIFVSCFIISPIVLLVLFNQKLDYLQKHPKPLPVGHSDPEYSDILDKNYSPDEDAVKLIRTSFTEHIEPSQIETLPLPSLIRYVNRKIAHFHFYEKVKEPELHTALSNFFFVQMDFHNFCPEPYKEEHQTMGDFVTPFQMHTFESGPGKELVSSLTNEFQMCLRAERSLSDLHLIRDTPQYYYIQNTLERSLRKVISNLNESLEHFSDTDPALIDSAERILARVCDEIVHLKTIKNNELIKNKELKKYKPRHQWIS